MDDKHTVDGQKKHTPQTSTKYNPTSQISMLNKFLSYSI